MPTQQIQHLGKWLALGALAGAAVVGIAIGAYAIGYHRGQHHRHATSATRPTTTSAVVTTAAPSPSTAAVTATPALVARGKQLYGADGCAACHTLSGAATVGPTFKGLSGSKVTLATGQSVTADDAYLERSITSPDAEIVKGYHPGLMAPAIAPFQLTAKPDDIRALVAFIKTQK